MNVAWEKIVLWIIGIIVLLVIIAFMVSQLGDGSGSVISKLWEAMGLKFGQE